MDLQPSIDDFRELALFAGAGGGILASKLLGWRTVCAVERDAYAAQVLAQRQNDGSLSPFPIWSDVTSFDGKPWNGIIDVISGGFPCQDISTAGKGEGIEGKNSGLWKQMARIIGEVRPRFVFVENTTALLFRGFGTVLADLSELGFDAKWGVLGAKDVGAPHKRNRLWVMGYTDSDRCDQRFTRINGSQASPWSEYRLESHRRAGLYPTPRVCRMADGLVHRMDRLRAIGNGQVPLCAATAWGLLNEN